MNTRLLRIFSVIAFFIIGAPLSATNFVNEFPIYMYGDTSYIATVYEFVKIYSNGIMTGGSAVQSIIGLGITMSVLIAGWRAKDGGWQAIGGATIAPTVLIALFLVPTVDVKIVDKRVSNGIIEYTGGSGGYNTVDSVPYAIAAIPSVSSTVVSFFIESIDNNWTSVSVGQQFSSLGFQGMSEVSKQAAVIADLTRMEDANVSGDMQQIQSDMSDYIQKCLITIGLDYDKRNKYILRTPTKTFPDMFNPSTFYGSFGTENVNINGTNMTCDQAYQSYVVDKETTIHDAMIGLLKAKRPKILNPESAAFTEAYKKQIGDTSNKISSIGKAMTIIAAQKTLEKDLSVEGIGVNGVTTATELTIQKTMGSLRTEGLAKFEWMARTLPDAITILLGIMIGVFPIMILVTSFYGANAFPVIANFFMGYAAINFNLVGLALVSNIISYYTAQHAAEAMASYAGMPFGMTQINDFMIQQADLAGFAGIIGTAAIFGITPLVFKGESAGLAAATGAIGGMFKGNIEQEGQKALTDYDAQMQLDKQNTTIDGLSETEAATFLSKEGFSRPAGMSAVQAYNDMQKNYQQIGAARTAQALHAGNMKDFNADNFIAGSAGQAMQRAAVTSGMGANMNEGTVMSATIDDIASVGIQDGIKTGASVAATQALREASGYNAEAVGAGMAVSQLASSAKLAALGGNTMAKMDEWDANANAAAIKAFDTKTTADSNQAKLDEISNLMAQNSQMDSENASSKDRMDKLKQQQQQSNNGHNISQSPAFPEETSSLLAKSIEDNNSQKAENQEKINELLDSLDAKGDSQDEKLKSAQSNVDDSKVEAQKAQDEYNSPNNSLEGTTAAALVATATSSALSEIGAGQGALTAGQNLDFLNADGSIKTGASADNFMHGAALKTESAMASQMGTGETGKDKDFMYKAHEEGARQGLSTSNSADLMRTGEDKQHRKIYDRDSAAKGEALKEVASLNASMETAKAASSKTGEVNGDIDYIRGSGAQARKAANDAIGAGEDFGSSTDANQVALMSKAKDIAKVGFRGQIEASAAEIAEHGGVDGAIKDMKTTAQEKGKASATHADNLREKYDDDLEGTNGKGMKLSEAMSAIDMSKLDWQEGQAAGVLANKGVNPDIHSDNAMYEEISQQQSTQAKIDTQGGVDAAVHTDVADASLKASKQQAAISGELAQQMIAGGMSKADASKIAKEYTKGGEEAARKMVKTLSDGATLKTDLNVANSAISGAVASAGALAGTLAEGKTAKDIGTVLGAEKRGGFAEASFKSGVEGGAEMGAAYDNMAAMTGSDNPDDVAQTLKNRTSMSDTKHHLIEDIGTFGLDKVNDMMGTNFDSEGAATAALLGGGAVSAEVFQAIRGQKGPIRTTIGMAKNGVVKAVESVGLIKPSPSNLNDTKQNTNGKQSSNSVNQNDSTHNGTSSSNIKNYTQEYGQSKEAFEKESRNLESLQRQRESLVSQGKDTTAVDNKIEDTSKKVDAHRVDMEHADRNIKAEKYLATKEAKMRKVNEAKTRMRIAKGGGLLATAAVAADLIATGEFAEAAEMLWDGAKDTGSKVMQGNITGKDGAAANLSSVLIGREATNSLASGNYSVAAMQTLTNIADGFGGILDMVASAMVAPFSDKTYAQLRNKDFSITQSGADIINDAVEWMTTSHGPAGGGGNVPGSSQYVPPHAQNAFSTPMGFNTVSAMNNTKTNEHATYVSAAEMSGSHKNDYAEASARVLENMNMSQDVALESTDIMSEQMETLVDALTPKEENGQS